MLEKLIKRCDMFSIIQFTRYNGQKSYRTITGGIVSIVLYGSLLTILVSLLMETLNYTNITVTSEDINFQLSPTYYALATNPAHRFMFAVGISGKNISLNSFDVVLQNYAIVAKSNESNHRAILMKPCNVSEWAGINDEVTQSFHGLNLASYLCPPADYMLQMQGKPTSDFFKYSMISVAECGKFNPNADCPKDPHIHGPEFDLTQKLNFFYINSQVNPKSREAVSYYIEDVNIFDLDLSSGFTANIYFQEFEITTDRSLMPWSQNEVQRGIYTKGEATTQSHTLQDKVYARIILRKSSQKLSVQRSFQKITKPISYIGGLSGPILMVLSVLKMYTIYAYQIQFGGKIFKQKTNSSFDSERFNFITYLKCRIYNIFKKFSFCQSWASIKDYYQCRQESIKQLDVHLLHKKLLFFEEVCNILLQKHYQIGLHLIPKKSIQASQIARLKYLYQTSIQKQQKSQEKKQKLSVQESSNFIFKDNLSQAEKIEYQRQQQLQRQFSSNFQRLKSESETGDNRALQIMKKIKTNPECDYLQKLGISSEQFRIHNANTTMISEFIQIETEQKTDAISKSP